MIHIGIKRRERGNQKERQRDRGREKEWGRGAEGSDESVKKLRRLEER